jgi:hypothetical protein
MRGKQDLQIYLTVTYYDPITQAETSEAHCLSATSEAGRPFPPSELHPCEMYLHYMNPRKLKEEKQ